MGAKVPPYSLEAEQSVLGCMLIDTESVAIAFESIRAEDFYRSENQEIFAAMETLFSQDKPIDVVTVSEQLNQNGTLSAVGGNEMIAGIAMNVPTTANIKHYINIIKEKSLLRKLIEAAGKIEKLSYEGSDDAISIAETSEKLIFDVLQGKNTKGFAHVKDVLDSNFAHLEELQKKGGRITGLETGFSHLDYLLSGLQNSNLIILAARPGVGKTSLALNIARHAAVKNNTTVAIFNLEMSKEEVVNRIWTSAAMVDSQRLKTGGLDADDWMRLAQAVGPLSAAPIYIDDTSTINVTEIRSKCRRLKLEKNLGLVVVDYLQLMQGKGDNRQQIVSDISRALKILAKELDVPVITLSQLSRSIEQRQDKTPLLSDLRESGSIEQDADVVMFLSKPESEEEESQLFDLIVAKHRSGSTGRIKLMWQPAYTTFASVETGYE